MKLPMGLRSCGRAATLMLGGIAVLASGCVETREVYVHREPPPPVVVETPVPVTAPVAAPPAQIVVTAAPVAPPAPLAPVRSGEQLEQLVAPIALYPDPLLAEVLPAATVPSQVVLADRYLKDGGDPNAVDLQPWDRSVQALARYPEVLSMMDNALAWTTDLGLAFLNQPTDLMNAVQRMRARAYALGNLQSNPQQVVYVEGPVIEIVPAVPTVIYVPVYAPDVVYVQRPPARVTVFVSFGAARPVGVWLNHDCDWHQHRLIVWRRDNPRPADWWARRPSQHRPEEVRNVTVWRPRPVTEVAQGPGDRGWGIQGVRTQPTPPRPAPAPTHQPQPRPEPAAPVHSGAHLVPGAQPPAPPPVRPRPAPTVPTKPVPSQPLHPVPDSIRSVPRSTAPASSRPVTTPPSPRPVTPPSDSNRPPVRSGAHPEPVAQKPAPQRRPVAAPAPARPAPAPRPAPSPGINSRPTGGALTGIESARETREFSSRGQQSREAMAKPAKPAPVRQAAPKSESRPAQPKHANSHTR